MLNVPRSVQVPITHAVPHSVPVPSHTMKRAIDASYRRTQVYLIESFNIDQRWDWVYYKWDARSSRHVLSYSTGEPVCIGDLVMAVRPTSPSLFLGWPPAGTHGKILHFMELGEGLAAMYYARPYIPGQDECRIQIQWIDRLPQGIHFDTWGVSVRKARPKLAWVKPGEENPFIGMCL